MVFVPDIIRIFHQNLLKRLHMMNILIWNRRMIMIVDHHIIRVTSIMKNDHGRPIMVMFYILSWFRSSAALVLFGKQHSENKRYFTEPPRKVPSLYPRKEPLKVS